MSSNLLSCITQYYVGSDHILDLCNAEGSCKDSISTFELASPQYMPKLEALAVNFRSIRYPLLSLECLGVLLPQYQHSIKLSLIYMERFRLYNLEKYGLASLVNVLVYDLERLSAPRESFKTLSRMKKLESLSIKSTHVACMPLFSFRYGRNDLLHDERSEREVEFELLKYVSPLDNLKHLDIASFDGSTENNYDSLISCENLRSLRSSCKQIQITPTFKNPFNHLSTLVLSIKQDSCTPILPEFPHLTSLTCSAEAFQTLDKNSELVIQLINNSQRLNKLVFSSISAEMLKEIIPHLEKIETLEILSITGDDYPPNDKPRKYAIETNGTGPNDTPINNILTRCSRLESVRIYAGYSDTIHYHLLEKIVRTNLCLTSILITYHALFSHETAAGYKPIKDLFSHLPENASPTDFTKSFCSRIKFLDFIRDGSIRTEDRTHSFVKLDICKLRAGILKS